MPSWTAVRWQQLVVSVDQRSQSRHVADRRTIFGVLEQILCATIVSRTTSPCIVDSLLSSLGLTIEVRAVLSGHDTRSMPH